MNILPLNSVALYNSNSVSNNRVDAYNYSKFGLKMSKPISADTVSFKARMAVLIEDAATKTNQKLAGDATVYMDALEAIAHKLKDFGVSFDRAYCEPNAIKSPKSIISKIKRAGNWSVPDRIRGTLYCKNIYDPKILVEQILPELSLRGYTLANIEVPIEEAMKRGIIPTAEEVKKGFVLLPDLDLRLSDIGEKRNLLPEKLKYSVGNPQPSGYEDIQIRFKKDTNSQRKNKQNLLHELIILVGPKYAQTKHDESTKIYNYTRQFKELNIMKRKDSKRDSIEKIKRYADLVSKLFSTEISQKVYENAKNHDMYGIEKEMPIKLSKEDEATLTTYYNSMEKLTREFYENLKASKSKNEQLVNKIDREYKEDMARLKNIRTGLTKAVEFYREYPKKQKNPKSKKA